MTEKEKGNACDLCKAELATTLCPECPKCYCDECTEFVHRKDPKKEHKIEHIPKGVNVKVTCPLHDDAFRMFCINDVKLCCFGCVVDNLHKDHKVTKIEEIEQDNETFSAAEVMKDFDAILKRDISLNKKIDETLAIIEKDVKEAKEKIEKSFKEEHQKLKDEEIRLLNELEEAYNKANERLNEIKASITKACEYSSVLSDAAGTLKMSSGDNDKKCSKLMELNIVSEMEEQRRKIEKLLGAEARDLKISWDREARKLSFTRNLFNGAPSVMNVRVNAVSPGEVDVSWETCSEEKNDDDEIRYAVEVRKEGEKDWKEAKSELTAKKCRVEGLMNDNVYEVRVRCVAKGGSSVGAWSDVVKEKTLKWKCTWKKCPDDVDDESGYSVDERNPRIATKINNSGLCAFIGNTLIPQNAVTSWNIKIVKSKYNDGGGIFIGVAQSDIIQDNVDNYSECGWYFNCYSSSLYSGAPHNHDGEEYGPRKEEGEYVHTGGTVGVVMDTTKGSLSFILDNVNLGVAYEGIPLDKPLVPCVLLGYADIIEIIT